MRVRSTRNSHPPLVGMQNGIVTLRIVWQFLTKLNVCLPDNPAALRLGLPKELKTFIHTKTCTWMFSSFSSELPKFGSYQGVLQWVNKQINSGTSREWEEMNYQVVKRHGGIFNAYF